MRGEVFVKEGCWLTGSLGESPPLLRSRCNPGMVIVRGRRTEGKLSGWPEPQRNRNRADTQKHSIEDHFISWKRIESRMVMHVWKVLWLASESEYWPCRWMR